MNAERLTALADLLDTVPAKAFNLGDWQIAEPSRPEGEKEGECGFAGCAVGWAAHAGIIHGLTMQPTQSVITGSAVTPSFDGLHGWLAVHKCFDLTRGQALTLFDAWSYEEKYETTPAQVAGRIRSFVLVSS